MKKIVNLLILFSCFLPAFISTTSAKVFQSRTALGTCAGDSKSKGVGPISEDRKKLEKKCEPYDNKERDCKGRKECKWVPQPQVCEAIKEDKVEEDALFCDKILSKKDCDKESFKCIWGYKSPVCNAANASKKEDVEFCEKFDGTSEDVCERTPKCSWD